MGGRGGSSGIAGGGSGGSGGSGGKSGIVNKTWSSGSISGKFHIDKARGIVTGTLHWKTGVPDKVFASKIFSSGKGQNKKDYFTLTGTSKGRKVYLDEL